VEFPTVKFETFRSLVNAIPFGKKLPTSVYLARSASALLASELIESVRRAEAAAKPEPSWNLLKLHTDQFAISFLSYPDFDNDPHPYLAEATKINLNTGSVVRTDYRGRSNPPILHRKESFLPPGDPRLSQLCALTRQEEQEGLYRDPSRIGLRLHWQTLLKRSGLTYEGHRLVKQPCE
jgi:DNA phosphorothioation-associated putative methyltransferase